MATYEAKVELTDEEAARFEEYINDHCLDSGKWLSRQLYLCIYSAVARYKQRRGVIDPAFELNKRPAEKNKGKGGKIIYNNPYIGLY
jgi:hypothetical protein